MGQHVDEAHHKLSKIDTSLLSEEAKKTIEAVVEHVIMHDLAIVVNRLTTHLHRALDNYRHNSYSRCCFVLYVYV